MNPGGVYVVMGVSGCGKSTIAARLAAATGGIYIEGDDFHPAENKAKMASGVPLEDEDRWSWLESLNRELKLQAAAGKPVFLACSALRNVYRERLAVGIQRLGFIYLKGFPELLRKRLQSRKNHFMPPGLLESQFAVLEEPEEAVVVTVDQPVPVMVEIILKRLWETAGPEGCRAP